ncbi:MAG: putative 4-hydroxybenzoate polyprenyltransferase [Phycisphaerales bacterium]|nr:putative 4-hydroxybenzoate polyprenyltransferase [Phycisphaerales bacterium]
MTTLTDTPGSGLVGAVRAIASDIKIAHSVFALPFALLASVMAARPLGGVVDWSRFAGQAALVVVAMVCARSVAMLANRLIDAELDARNPRTAGRAIPSGRLARRTVSLAIGAFALTFLIVCAGFGVLYGNWWPLVLGGPVLAWISAYGWFKRFTALCHVYLGSSLAISPIAAALAVNPGGLANQPAVWLIGGMVLCWVAGFDVIYALQDVDVDRRDGLHSMPSRFGVGASMWISRGLHVGAVACLALAWRLDARFGLLFAGGVGLVSVLLVVEHATVARWGTSRIALAFFTLNGVISCVLGGLGIVDVLVA